MSLPLYNIGSQLDLKTDFEFGFLAIDYSYFDTKTTFQAYIIEEIEAKWARPRHKKNSSQQVLE